MGESSTTYLFAKPSFWTGYGSSVDLFGVMFEFNSSLTPEQADWLALRADWLAVGQDIRRAMSEISAVHPELEAVQKRN